MKNKKKAISICCGALLVSSLAFTGCGNGSAGQEDILSQEVTGEITVSCYNTMTYKGFLDEAAKAFEAKYPGTTVHVETFGEMPEIQTSEDGRMAAVRITAEADDQAKDDYISKISTELMSGGGADVLAMDILPYYKYAENGQLVDLKPLIEQDADFNLSNYRKNVIDATTYQGGQYIMPLDYAFAYFAYDSSLLSPEEQQPLQTSDAFSYEQLIDIAKEPFSEKKNKMFGLTADANRMPNMFSELLGETYESYVDIENKSVHFDDGRFAQLLETVKAYGEEGYINPAGQQEPQMTTSSFMQDQSERYFYKPKNSFNLLSHFNRIAGVRGNMMVSSGVSTGNEADDELAGIAANSEGEAAFTYQQAYGLNANSTNKHTAWAFIKFMLSEEMQTSPQLSFAGLPLHNDAREAKAEMLITGEFRPQMPAGVRIPDGVAGGNAMNRNADGESKPPADGTGSALQLGPEAGETIDTPAQAPGTLSEAQEKALEGYLTQSEAYADMLSRHVIRDEKIDTMITSEIKNFFNGTKSAADVAKALQGKVELYLNE